MNRRTFLAAAVSAAMLTGCAVGPDYNRPYVPVPKDYDTFAVKRRMSIF